MLNVIVDFFYFYFYFLSQQLTNEIIEEIVSTLSAVVTEGNEVDQTGANVNEMSVIVSNIVNYISESDANITTNVSIVLNFLPPNFKLLLSRS